MKRKNKIESTVNDLDTNRNKVGELCYKRLSKIGVFLLWKIEYPDYYITVMRIYCKKSGCYGRHACFIAVERTALP